MSPIRFLAICTLAVALPAELLRRRPDVRRSERELAAQTAGINNGWQNRLRNGPDAVSRGWIVGVKSARFSVDVLPLGAEIRVTSENSFEFEGFREIRSSAKVNGRSAAEITLQLMQADQDKGIYQ